MNGSENVLWKVPAFTLLFRSEEHIGLWCRRKDSRRVQSSPPEHLWELSKLWYHDRLSVDYHGRTAPQAEEILKQSGLTSAFWQAPHGRLDQQTSRLADYKNRRLLK